MRKSNWFLPLVLVTSTTTAKNKRTKPEKMGAEKYDPVVRQHVIYKEAKNQIILASTYNPRWRGFCFKTPHIAFHTRFSVTCP